MAEPAAPVKRPVTERWWWFFVISAGAWPRSLFVAVDLATARADEIPTIDWLLAGSFVVMLCIFVWLRWHEARKRVGRHRRSSTATERGQPPPDTLTR